MGANRGRDPRGMSVSEIILARISIECLGRIDAAKFDLGDSLFEHFDLIGPDLPESLRQHCPGNILVPCQILDVSVTQYQPNTMTLADAPDSKSGPRKRVWVQVPPSVLSRRAANQADRMRQGPLFFRANPFLIIRSTISIITLACDSERLRASADSQ
jgi:sulfite reductase alpha subunit-like flavoprotein